MQDLGKLLAVLGGAGFLAAVFLMPTTVPYGGDAVTNLSLQQQQMIAVAASLTLVLAGTILAASGAIADALRPAPPAQDAEADPRLVALGITRQGKDYVFNGFVYRTEAEATAMAEQAAQRR